MSKARPNLLMPILAGIFAIAVGGSAATALAHEDSDYGWDGYYSGHVQREQDHMARERRHMWRERRERDEAFRQGDWWDAWRMQQHLNHEGRHLRREQEHVGHELFEHD